MKRKKFSNEETAKFSSAVKELSRLLGKSPHVVHNRLKEKFGYMSYCFLWRRKKEILEFVQTEIKKIEFNRY